MNRQVVVLLAEGFEEIEAVTPIDFLRRLGLNVVVASINGLDVYGAHGICIEAERSLANVDCDNIAMLVLPGGMPGSMHLRDSEQTIELIRKVYGSGGYVAAICAAPIALAKAGITDGRRVTVYPGMESMMGNAICTGNMLETDERIITGKGPGASFVFARKLAEVLGMEREAAETFELMFLQQR